MYKESSRDFSFFFLYLFIYLHNIFPLPLAMAIEYFGLDILRRINLPLEFYIIYHGATLLGNEKGENYEFTFLSF